MSSSLIVTQGNAIGSESSIYTPAGHRWIFNRRKEMLEAYDAAKEIENRSSLLESCSHCQSFAEHLSDDRISHQPGYLSLVQSARTCNLCWMLAQILEENLRGSICVHADTDRLDDESLFETNDEFFEAEGISIVRIPLIQSKPSSPFRYRLHWVVEKPYFECRSEVFGVSMFNSSSGVYSYTTCSDGSLYLYTEQPRAIWVNVDGDAFEPRFEAVVEWVSTCNKDHKNCPVGGKTKLPTRVLDVEPADGSHNVRLHISNAQEAEYVALSHCWGTTTPIQTTTANVSDRLNGISMSELPKTFQEAVLVVRRLGIRYLWIDTLCIVQDDTFDWQVESVRMNEIYHHASLTLAATAAENCQAGLFQSFKPSPRVRISDWTFAARICGPYSVENKPILESRAWTLQEDILSRRIVYFGKVQLRWRCLTQAVTEDQVLDDYDEVVKSMPLVDSRDELGGPFPTNTADLKERWKRIVESYASRNITYENDRLPALAGITKQYSQLLDDRPLLGLWHNSLAEFMLWTTYGVKSHDTFVLPRRRQNIPTWSWLSISGSIEYEDDTNTVIVPAAKTLSASVTWRGAEMVSEIATVVLQLEGALLPVSLRPADIKLQVPMYRLDMPEDKLSTCRMDTHFESAHVTARCFKIVTICRSRTASGEDDPGQGLAADNDLVDEGVTETDHLRTNGLDQDVVLVLLPVAERRWTYQRIGICELPQKRDEDPMRYAAWGRVSLI